MNFQINEVIPHKLNSQEIIDKLLSLKDRFSNYIDDITVYESMISITGSHFNVVININESNLLIRGTEDLVGRLAEPKIIKMIKENV